MTHVFISYAKAETRDLAIRLTKILQQQPNVTVWMDTELESGEAWFKQIEDEIKRADYIVVLMSPDIHRIKTATQNASFVPKEINFAMQLHKEVIPVMAQWTSPPIIINDIQYIDFTANEDAGITKLVQRIVEHPVNITALIDSTRTKTASHRRPMTALAGIAAGVALIVIALAFANSAGGNVPPTLEATTAIAANVNAPTSTATHTATLTQTSTATRTATKTATQTYTPSNTHTATATHTPTSTRTPAATRTPSQTPALPTPTASPTQRPTETPIPTRGLQAGVPASQLKDVAGVVVVRSDIFDEPRESAEYITTLTEGETVTIAEERLGWYRIIGKWGEGWVINWAVRPQTAESLYTQESVSLEHEPDSYVYLKSVNQNVRDFVIQASFSVPYGLDVHSFDFGFTFRQSEGKEYRLIFQAPSASSVAWALDYVENGQFYNQFYTYLQEQIFRTQPDQVNHVQLYAYRDIGYVMLNGVFIGMIDLSQHTLAGDLGVGTDYYIQDEANSVKGKQTLVKDITVTAFSGCILTTNDYHYLSAYPSSDAETLTTSVAPDQAIPAFHYVQAEDGSMWLLTQGYDKGRGWLSAYKASLKGACAEETQSEVTSDTLPEVFDAPITLYNNVSPQQPSVTYRIVGRVGDLLSLQGRASAAVDMSIYLPDETVLFNTVVYPQEDGRDLAPLNTTIALPVSGTYKLVIDNNWDEESGDFSFEIDKVNRLKNVQYGDSITDVFESEAVYAVAVQEGDKLDISVIGDFGYDPQPLRLFDSQGKLLALKTGYEYEYQRSEQDYYYISHIMEKTETAYLHLVPDEIGTEYTLVINGSPLKAAIAPDFVGTQRAQAYLNIGESIRYRFNLAAGEQLRILLAAAHPMAIQVFTQEQALLAQELITVAPTSTEAINYNQVVVSAQTQGTYEIQLRALEIDDWDNEVTAINYTLTLERQNIAQILDLDQPVQLANPTDTLYWIDGIANQRLEVELVYATSVYFEYPKTHALIMYDSDGEIIGQLGPMEYTGYGPVIYTLPITISTTDTYMLRVIAPFDGQSNPYTLTLREK